MLFLLSQAKQAAGGCQPHGNLTPAHADGCAARCFEGVQCGSIFKGAGGRGPQSAALFLKNACVAPSCPEIMAGVLPQLAPARMYLSALCSAATATPFSRCSLGPLSACIGHQFLDGRCTRIKKPTEAPWPFGVNSACLSVIILHDFHPFVSPVRSTMADANRTGLVCPRRFFRQCPLFKCALMAAKAPLVLHRTRGAFAHCNPSQIETHYRMALPRA